MVRKWWKVTAAHAITGKKITLHTETMGFMDPKDLEDHYRDEVYHMRNLKDIHAEEISPEKADTSSNPIVRKFIAANAAGEKVTPDHQLYSPTQEKILVAAPGVQPPRPAAAPVATQAAPAAAPAK